MKDIKNSGSAESMPMAGSSCGIKPSYEALEKGYELDFSKAKDLLEIEIQTNASYEKNTLNKANTDSLDMLLSVKK